MSNCVVCGLADFRPRYNGLLMTCSNCGFVTAAYDEQAFRADQLYDLSYFTGNEYEDYFRDGEIFVSNFRGRLRSIARHSGTRPFTRTLEIGCACGFFGLALQKDYPMAHYTGIDVADAMTSYGRKAYGLNLHTADYLKWFPQGELTDIFLWDVVEHLQRPDLVFAKAFGELAPGGRLYLTTGDIGAMVPRLQGKRWRMIHPPSHLHYFSKRTITQLLEGKNFQNVRVLYPAYRRNVKQMFYSLFLLKKGRRPSLEWLYHRMPDGLSLSLNLFDIMLVIAEKAGGPK